MLTNGTCLSSLCNTGASARGSRGRSDSWAVAARHDEVHPVPPVISAPGLKITVTDLCKRDPIGLS